MRSIDEIIDYSPMEWTSEYSVDVPDLDNQHKELMSFFNMALIHCSRDAAEEKEYFNNVIEVFLSFLALHFKTEEQFFFGKDDPLFEEHRLEHVKLLEKVNLVKEEVQSGRWEINLYVLTTTLKEWLLYHFNACDIGIREYFRVENSMEKECAAAFAFG